ncbi:MAG: hypothetical protein QM579_00410 [Desulfovibrio sp.]
MQQTLRHFLGLGMGLLLVKREAAPAGSGLMASEAADRLQGQAAQRVDA